ALPAVVILAVLRTPKKIEHILQIQSGFLAVAAISGVAFVVAFNPNLGMARDWDVLAVALWPLLFFAAWKMACTDLGTLRAELLAFVVGFACVISIPFILVQTGEAISIARFEILLHMDASRSAYGWENLAVHYESTGYLDGRIRAWEGAVQASNNPRYMINYANVLRMADRLDEAEVYSVRGARFNPEYAYQLTHIATAYALRDNFEKARELLTLAIELDSTDSRARKLLQRTEWEIARRDSTP
ncbi:tetratricopeptide repeat protein, partial [bacterium]|nr:tetratricopeptide repeat protein [bacterium]